MTPKSFVYLAGVAVVSALVALVTFASTNQWGGAPIGGERLMPALESSIGQVAEVSIRQGNETVVLQRQGGSWSLKSKGGYPVDIPKVRALLVGLGQAELAEPKTNRPDKYAALELEDPAEKGAKSRLVKLTDANGNTIAEAVLGKTRDDGYGAGRRAGTYVRKPGDPQTWLASVELNAPMATKDWVKTAVLALEAEKIDRVSIEIAGEEPLRIERAPKAAAKDGKAPHGSTAAAAEAGPGKDAETAGTAARKDAGAAARVENDTQSTQKQAGKATPAPPAAEPGKLAFVGFPVDGKKLKDASAAEGLVRAASSIDLEDVRKLPAPPPADGASIVRLERADGLTATLRLRKEDDAHWLSIVATGAEGDAKKAAEEITARTEGWEFKIPSYKADLILKKRADLIEASES